MKPTANYLLVAVPQRFVSQHTPGTKRLVLPSGSDDWKELNAQILAGEDVQIETDETPIPVCQGTVLALPDRLTADMLLCASPHTKLVPHYEAVLINGKTVPSPQGGRLMRSTGRLVEQNIPRTAADITEQAQVGDTIHFDEAALSDDSEVSPGVYLVGYADVIAALEFAPLPHEGQNNFDVQAGNTTYHVNAERLCRSFAFNKSLENGTPNPYAEPRQPVKIMPLAGYVLLTRVWADDVQEAEVEGRTRKVRYGKSGLIDQTDVPPLSNEGIVAWHSAPLRGTKQECFVGDRVIIEHSFAREETIAGVSYLAIRQDFIMAVREKPELGQDVFGNLIHLELQKQANNYAYEQLRPERYLDFVYNKLFGDPT